MAEEMHGGPVWRKAIPEARDRMQSRGLVAVVGALLALLCLVTALEAVPLALQILALPLGAAMISIGFAVLVRGLRAATTAGAIFGGMICLVMTFWTGSVKGSILRSGLTPLVLLFVLTFLATRAGKAKKARAGLAEGRRGRSAAQVIANLSAAALSVVPWTEHAVDRWMPGAAGPWTTEAVKVMCLAALVEATADTASSEIGQAFGGRPVMLLSLRAVDPGTDGAVSLVGSGAGVAAGALLAMVGAWAMGLGAGALLVALAAGVLGLFFDSLLGATVERRGWLGNDLVNFISTVFAALAAAAMYRYVML